MDLDAFFGTDQVPVVAIKAVVTYWYVVFLLRLSGKRTTMSMTSFDYVSTVAMATIIGSTIVSPSVTLISGLVAITALVATQWVVGSISARSQSFRDVIVSTPTLLFKDSQFIEENLRAERISPEQILQKIRAAGHADTRSVGAVVIESASTVSVIDNSGNKIELDLKA